MDVLVAAVRVARRGQGAQTAIARLYYGVQIAIGVEMKISVCATLPTTAMMARLDTNSRMVLGGRIRSGNKQA
jgi:hypothetical protein